MDKKEITNEINLEGKYHYGLGRRKTAIAKVRLYKGHGRLIVNGREDYFGGLQNLVKKIFSPLATTGNQAKFDVSAHVNGGGVAAHADAILLGVARALKSMDNELKPTLRKAGYLTRDPRIKERKKPGLKRARKAPQFSKR